MNLNNLEEKGLNKEEIEYIKRTMIYFEEIKPGADILKVLSWRNTLERKVLKEEATSEEVVQYERLREIEIFMDMLSGFVPKDIFEFSDFAQILDERDMKFMAKIMLNELDLDIRDAFDRKELEKELEEEYEQDIEEPFIKDLIDKLLKEGSKGDKFRKVDSGIESAEFEHISDETIASIAYLILKETQNAKKNNQKLKFNIKKLNKNTLLYLVMKNLAKAPVQIEETPKNIYAENCPADAIREYIEEIVGLQKNYLAQGKEVPEELLIPQEIILSPQNIEFLINSKLVDYIGAGETGNEIQFYWKKTEKLPALELRAERREDGKFILSYIKEEATNEKQEFVWDKKTQEGKKGTIVVSKIQDALEDICDMDR